MKWLLPFWSHMVTLISTQYLNLSKGHMEAACHFQTNAQVWISVEFSFDFQVALPTRAKHHASVISVWHSTVRWERTRTTTCSNVSHLGGFQRYVEKQLRLTCHLQGRLEVCLNEGRDEAHYARTNEAWAVRICLTARLIRTIANQNYCLQRETFYNFTVIIFFFWNNIYM